MSEEATVVIQQADGDPEIYKEMGPEEASGLVAERDPAAGERLRAAEQRLAAIDGELMSDPDLAVEYYILHYQKSRADKVAHERLADLSAEEQTEEVERFRRFTELGTCLLYRDADFRGSSRFCTVTWPNLSWSPYNFNDAASSVKGWGFNMLFEHSWYRGRRLYVVGLPYVELRNLRELGFDDLTSSVVCP